MKAEVKVLEPSVSFGASPRSSLVKKVRPSYSACEIEAR